MRQATYRLSSARSTITRKGEGAPAPMEAYCSARARWGALPTRHVAAACFRVDQRTHSSGWVVGSPRSGTRMPPERLAKFIVANPGFARNREDLVGGTWSSTRDLRALARRSRAELCPPPTAAGQDTGRSARAPPAKPLLSLRPHCGWTRRGRHRHPSRPTGPNAQFAFGAYGCGTRTRRAYRPSVHPGPP